MKRIDGDRVHADKFGAGKHGFTDGDANTKPSKVTADWADNVQEELARTVEAAGLELDGDDLDQLAEAVGLVGTSGGLGFFGNGDDGTVNYGSNTTPTTDVNGANVTVDAGVTLKMQGWVLRCQGLLTIDGTITTGAEDGDNLSGGAAYSDGTIAGNNAGGDGGGAGLDGNAGTDGMFGGAGGDGGDSGGNNGGAAGAVPAPSAGLGSLSLPGAACGYVQGIDAGMAKSTLVLGGGSGGGGADLGGGGGADGGTLVICANRIHVTPTGEINANGGTGGDGMAPDGGGGGGGGAGTIILVYRTLLNEGVIEAVGGPKGNATGAGLDGAAGSVGGIYHLRV